MLLKDRGLFREAACLFETLNAVDTGALDDPIAYDEKIFRELSLEPLGACYFKLGEAEKSLACYRRCEEIDPASAEYRIKRRFMEARLRNRAVRS